MLHVSELLIAFLTSGVQLLELRIWFTALGHHHNRPWIPCELLSVKTHHFNMLLYVCLLIYPLYMFCNFSMSRWASNHSWFRTKWFPGIIWPTCPKLAIKEYHVFSVTTSKDRVSVLWLGRLNLKKTNLRGDVGDCKSSKWVQTSPGVLLRSFHKQSDMWFTFCRHVQRPETEAAVPLKLEKYLSWESRLRPDQERCMRAKPEEVSFCPVVFGLVISESLQLKISSHSHGVYLISK